LIGSSYTAAANLDSARSEENMNLNLSTRKQWFAKTVAAA